MHLYAVVLSRIESYVKQLEEHGLEMEERQRGRFISMCRTTFQELNTYAQEKALDLRPFIAKAQDVDRRITALERAS
jgi:hypothetical protein